MQAAIIGAAGAIGQAVSTEFTRRGVPHRLIGRDEAKLRRVFGPDASITAADITDIEAGARALEGAAWAVYAVGLPYPQFAQHPVLMSRAIEAAKRAGVRRIIVVSSVYSYGVPQTPRVAETHPRKPRARKGQLRKQQEDIAMAADTPECRTLVLRLPDFYGPHAENSLADQVFRGAIKDAAANWLGPADLPHEFVYVPDAAVVIGDLLQRDAGFGEAWNLGGPGTITGREFIQKVYAEAGQPPRFRSAGAMMLRLGGLFNPLLRELVELHYLATTPVILDDSRLQRLLGSVKKTPYDKGIRETWSWYRSRL